MTKQMWKFYPLIFCALFEMGCTSKVEYEPPIVQMSEEWQTLTPSYMTKEAMDQYNWWKELDDPILELLIETATSQNLDLQIATTRVMQARLASQGKNAQKYPHIDASLSAGHLDGAKNGLLDKIVSDHSLRNTDFFEVGFDAEWELDLFGALKHEANALYAIYEATEDELCIVWLTLTAEIAKNYIELRALQELEIWKEKAIQIEAEHIKAIQELEQLGLSTSLDALPIQQHKFELAVELSKIQIAELKAIHRLSILLGYLPADLVCLLSEQRMMPCLPISQPIGVPSELLRRRPDIRKAERELAAATEYVNSAIASLFPRFSLRGFIGDISTHLKSLTAGSSGLWFAQSELLMPIFNSKLLLHDVKDKKLKAQEACHRYQKVVLEVLEEAEGAIASFHFGLEQQDLLEKFLQLSAEAEGNSEELYEKGVKNYVELLNVQRIRVHSEAAVVEGKKNLLLDYVALYKSLGGSYCF